MYTFLCQVDDRVNLDFVLATLNAVDFAKWWDATCEYDSKTIKTYEDLLGYTDKVIPVGSIEFVENYYKNVMGLTTLKPINIPFELFDFAKREVWYGTEKERIKGKVFCKSADKIKKFTDIIDNKTKLEKGNYFFSDVIEDIDSEWRCFVLKGELIAIHNYINSLGLYPDINEIKEMVKAYKGLDAYTLDVGVNKDKGTFVIEVHDFYSCGLYGFNNNNKLLQMLIASHNQKIKRRLK